MGEQTTDQELVERVQAGDKKAFDLLVLKYHNRIVKLVSRFVHDPIEAQDVAQEAFIRHFAQSKGFEARAPFTPGFIALPPMRRRITWFPRVDAHLP